MVPLCSSGCQARAVLELRGVGGIRRPNSVLLGRHLLTCLLLLLLLRCKFPCPLLARAAPLPSLSMPPIFPCHSNSFLERLSARVASRFQIAMPVRGLGEW